MSTCPENGTACASFEQLLGRGLESSIAAWHRGAVRFVHELRPETVKDDAIPELLRTQPQPTFVTVNVKDFRRKIKADPRFCVVCLPLSDSETGKIPRILKQLLRRPDSGQRGRGWGT
jgi:hypothetical protein